MAAIVFATFIAVGAALASGDEEQALAAVRRRLVVPVAPVEAGAKLRWRADWDEAAADARRRNCPLLVVFSDDQSVGFKTVEAGVHSKPAFLEFSRDVVLLIAFDGGDHKSTMREVGGEKVAWCGLFDVPCEAHRELHRKIEERFVSREYWNPLHLFVDADGNEVGRAEGHEIDQARLDRELGKARRRLGAAIGATDYAAVMKRVKGIVDARERTGAAAAVAELGELVTAQDRMAAEPFRGPLRTRGMVEFVNELRKGIGEEGDAQVAVAQAKVRGGDVAGARALLDVIARSYRELPAGKRARELLAQLK